MKRTITVMLSLILMIGLLAACGNKQAATQAASKPSPEEPSGLEDSIFQDNATNGGQTQESPQPGNQGTSLPGQNPTQPSSGQEQTPTTPTTPSTPTTPTTPTIPSTPSGPASIDYETFKAMTGAQKKAYQESFPTMDAFFEWYNAALKAYQDANPPTEIDGSGTVTLP